MIRLVTVLFSCVTAAAQTERPLGSILSAAAPLRFEENAGQAASGVRYLGRGAGFVALLSDTDVKIQAAGGVSLGVSLIGANPGSTWEGSESLGYKTAYYIGSNPAAWKTNVPNHGRVTRREVYPGVDLVFHGVRKQLEYDFILKPGADPNRIRLAFQGATAVRIDRGGDLVVETPGGNLVHKRPVVFQEWDGVRQAVEGAWVKLKGAEVGFRVGKYDPARELTIDPVIEFSSYVGGPGDDRISAVATTFLNEIIVAGTTSSLTVAGSMRGTVPTGPGTDGFVMMIAPSGQIRFLTFLGGSGNDRVLGVSVTALELLVTGETSSEDFPVVSEFTGVSPPSYGGGASDAFVARIRFDTFSAGQLAWARSLGGSGDDRGLAIAIAAGSTAIIAGETTSPDLSVGIGTYSGGVDAFVAQVREFVLSPSFTYIGGKGDDRGSAILVADAIYLAGSTNSADFPVRNAVQASLAGGTDAFLARLATTGNLAAGGFATYVGGAGDDTAHGIARGPLGQIAIVGTTASEDFPVRNALQGTRRGPKDAFLTLLNPARDSWEYSTYYGGSLEDEGAAVAATLYGWTMAGSTTSPDLLLKDALQGGFGGQTDGYVLLLNPRYEVESATYFGGSGRDRIEAIAVDSYGAVAVAGQTDSPDLVLEKPVQERMLAAEGFVAFLGNNLIRVFDAVLAKDTQTDGSAFIGRFPGPGGLNVSIRTNDPEKLLVSAQADRAGSERITVLIQNPRRLGSFYLQALADSGEATFTVSAPGYPDQTGRVRFGTLGVQVSTLTGSNIGDRPLEVVAGAQQELRLSLIARDEEGSFNFVRPRGGIDPVPATLAVEDTSVATVEPAIIRLDSGFFGGLLSILAAAEGRTEVRIAFPSLGLSRQIPLEVQGLAAKLLTTPVGKDLTAPIAVTLNGRAQPIPATVTSSDPSLLTVSATEDGTGGAQAIIRLGSVSGAAFYVHGLASEGSVRVDVAAPGIRPVSDDVTLTPSGFVVSAVSPVKVLEPLPVYMYPVQLNRETLEPERYQRLRPGAAPVSVNVSSSNGAAGTLAATALTVEPGRSFASTEFRPTAPGETELRAEAPPGFAEPRGTPGQRIVVKAPSWLMSGTLVGKDLQSAALIQLSAPRSQDLLVTVRSGDSGRVQLLTRAGGPPASSVEIPIPRGSVTAPVNLIALGEQGEIQLTATASGYSPTTALVRLAPSGILADVSRIEVVPGQEIRFALRAAVLDPATRQPVAFQGFRAGFTPRDVEVRAEDPAVVELAAARVSVSAGGQGEVSGRSLKAGTTVLRIGTPAGFTQPASRVEVPVLVRRPGLFLGLDGTPGKNQQSALRVSTNAVGARPVITVSSSDPTRVLVSTTPATVGGPSVRLASGETVWVQSLSDEGRVTLRAEADGLDPAALEIGMLKSGFRWLTQGDLDTTLFSQPVRLLVAMVEPASGRLFDLRPGAGPVAVDLSNSAPSVASLSVSRVVFEPGFPLPEVEVRPTGLGSTRIAVSTPDGYSPVGGSELTVTVRQPRLTVTDMKLGINLQARLPLSVDGPLPDGVSIRVTSSDPSRVLVSDLPNAEGSASILVTGDVFVQALAGQGTAALRAEAAGLEPVSATVTLGESAVNRVHAGVEVW